MKTQGDTWAIVNLLKPIFPSLHRPLYHQLITDQDMKFFRKHNMHVLLRTPNLLVPKMINLDDMYRASFNIDDNGFNKEVEKEMKNPGMEEIFGEDSASAAETVQEEQPSVQEPPTKKKKTKVRAGLKTLFDLLL